MDRWIDVSWLFRCVYICIYTGQCYTMYKHKPLMIWNTYSTYVFMYIYIYICFSYVHDTPTRWNILYVEHLIGWVVEAVKPPFSDGFILGIAWANCSRNEPDSTGFYPIVWPVAGAGSYSISSIQAITSFNLLSIISLYSISSFMIGYYPFRP